MIITDLCVFEVGESGLVLTELAPGVTLQEIEAKTEAKFTASDRLKEVAV
jgi:acyl CoA:acetate/3-ketoacid CoA transferase beta subunit